MIQDVRRLGYRQYVKRMYDPTLRQILGQIQRFWR